MSNCSICKKDLSGQSEPITICDECKTDKSTTLEVVADHYQKTFELVSVLWQERNKYFVFLLITIGIELLLVYREESFLKEYITLTGNVPINIPYNISTSILLLIILYLMIVIFQRTSYINNIYKYLGKVETESQALLSYSKSENSETIIAFSREGVFYKENKNNLISLTGIVYTILLISLLIPLILGFSRKDEAITNLFSKSAVSESLPQEAAKDSKSKLETTFLPIINFFGIIGILIYYSGYFYITAIRIIPESAKKSIASFPKNIYSKIKLPGSIRNNVPSFSDVKYKITHLSDLNEACEIQVEYDKENPTTLTGDFSKFNEILSKGKGKILILKKTWEA